MKTAIALLATLAAILFVLGAGSAPAQGRYNKAAFEKVMEQANRENRVLLGSLIAANWGRAGSTAETIEELSAEIRTLTPKRNTDRIDHFRATADSLGVWAGRLAAAAEAEDGRQISEAFGKMVGACVHCHATFRE
ncbi:MAG: hypothetical protein GF346_03675 [Candidatus Eisenbacteria bacterium]|nr:hypothetical protein [Candidatus Latescibacterota bacterium]MBD3301523.1 hypothetical protein [Candidatus Eisenbacteria bacterium]